MEITSISYGLTKNLNYSDAERIEVSADIDEQEDASEVLAYLQNWVEQRLKVREGARQLEFKKNELQAEVYRLESNLEATKAKWQKMQDFLGKLGISDVDDIPF